MFAPAPSAPPSSTRAFAQPRVLVVDDEPTVRMIARIMLERDGYVVEEAADAATAIAQVQAAESLFDVVLIDLTLPDRRGTALVPELRVLTAQSRIVLTSGRPEEDVPNHGADAYLPKPYAREQLLAVIGSVVASVSVQEVPLAERHKSATFNKHNQSGSLVPLGKRHLLSEQKP